MHNGPRVLKMLHQGGPTDPTRPSMSALLCRVPADPDPIRASWQRLLAIGWVMVPWANVDEAIELGLHFAAPNLAAVCTDRAEGERVALEMLLAMDVA